MAETKYDLLLQPRRASTKKIQHQPWYKERLALKYNNKQNRTSLSDTSGWTFIKNGMDDFRDGLPPVMNGSVVIQGKKGIKPHLRGDKSRNNSPKQRIRAKLSKDDLVYSKKVPSHKKRIASVDNLEQHLLAHPLALYPHIEESIAPDTFDELVTLLDPALVITDEFHYADDEIPLRKTATRGNQGNNDDDASVASSMGFRKVFKDPKNKWLYQTREEIEKEERAKAKDKKLLEAQQADNKLDMVTKEFCDWVRDLGGEANNIAEATVNSLFASGYDTKPTLSVPVRVVEAATVPDELRDDSPTPPADARQRKGDGYTPSWVKVKYGAWYLNPNKWKVLMPGQPLVDPKELEGQQLSEAKKNSKELDKVLQNMHGAKSFKSFMEEKDTRKPEFLDSVNSYDEQEIEERVNQEKLKKRLTRKQYTMSPQVVLN